MTNSNTIISVRNLSKSYRLYGKPSDRLREVLMPWKKRHTLFHALHEVNFEVHKGMHLGIIGANGAGKSTLLQILTGVLTPSQGEVTVNGRVAALLELGAGFNPELTGRENVTFLTSILGLPNLNTKEYLEGIEEFAGLGQFIDQPVKVYSSGMFARLAFALNIATLPDILIVDEALAVGDSFFQQKCLRRMKEYRERGTILFVSHDTNSVVSLCEHALWLENGTVREFGPAKDVCKHYEATNYEQSFATPEVINLSLEQSAPNICSAKAVEQAEGEHAARIQAILAELVDSPVSRLAKKESFGDGRASILECTLENAQHDKSSFGPGDTCLLTMYFICKTKIKSIIAGFIFKNRLGQNAYGTNTYRHGAHWSCDANEVCAITMEFCLPDLCSGEYLINIAIAEGTLEAHTQLHWIHDALALRFTSQTNDGTVVAATCKKCALTKSTIGL